jgi:hypothetical protein
MTVRELRQLLFNIENQNAKVLINTLDTESMTEITADIKQVEEEQSENIVVIYAVEE